MEILYCSFCEKTFYTVNGMVLHYLRDHYYSFNRGLSYCALCEYQGLSIASHMTEAHPLHCGYCSRVLTANNDHSEWTNVLQRNHDSTVEQSRRRIAQFGTNCHWINVHSKFWKPINYISKFELCFLLLQLKSRGGGGGLKLHLITSRRSQWRLSPGTRSALKI